MYTVQTVQLINCLSCICQVLIDTVHQRVIAHCVYILADIDECLEGSHICEVDTGFVSCINTNGAYDCECHEGYEFAPGGQMLACVGMPMHTYAPSVIYAYIHMPTRVFPMMTYLHMHVST